MGGVCSGVCEDETELEAALSDVEDDPPLAGRWYSARGNLQIVGVDVVQWRSGDVTKLKKKRAGRGYQYDTELNGTVYTAHLTPEGDLQWSDGDLWKRDMSGPQTGTYAAVSGVLARAGESFHGAYSTVVSGVAGTPGATQGEERYAGTPQRAAQTVSKVQEESPSDTASTAASTPLRSAEFAMQQPGSPAPSFGNSGWSAGNPYSPESPYGAAGSPYAGGSPYAPVPGTAGFGSPQYATHEGGVATGMVASAPTMMVGEGGAAPLGTVAASAPMMMVGEGFAPRPKRRIAPSAGAGPLPGSLASMPDR